MTEVSPLLTPDFTIQALNPDGRRFYQTPLNTPLENIRRTVSATVISETHQLNGIDTDKPNFIPFLTNATESDSQDADLSFPELDLISESPNRSTFFPT